MTTSTPDHDRHDCETAGFKIAEEKIEKLLMRLTDEENVCPCCVARALALHAAAFADDVLGSAKAIELLEYVMPETPAPVRGPSAGRK
jgi:hypothetical protein